MEKSNVNDQININGRLCAPLTAQYYLIGRSDQCDILLPENDAGVSRRHAVLQSDGQGVWSVTDLESTNGTFVNGSPVRGSRVLSDGDCITIGSSSIKLLAPRAQPAPVIPPPRPEERAPVAAPDESPSPMEFPFASPSPATEAVKAPVAAPATVEVPLVAAPPSSKAVPVPAAAPVTDEIPLVAAPPSPGAVPVAAPVTVEVPAPALDRLAPPTQEFAPSVTPFDARVLPSGNQPAFPQPQDIQPAALPVSGWPSSPGRGGSEAGSYNSLFLLWHFLTYGVAILMAVSLFLPWLNFNLFWVHGAYSYAQGLVEVFQVDGKLLIDGIEKEPRVLFLLLPLATTLSLLSAAGHAFIPLANRVFVQSLYLLAGGAAGALASLWFYGELSKANNQVAAFVPMNLNGFVGIGIPLYAFTSFAAIAVGLMGLTQMNGKQGRGN